MGIAIPLSCPYWGNNAETLHTSARGSGSSCGASSAARVRRGARARAVQPALPGVGDRPVPDDAICVATFHSVFPQTTGMDILAEWTGRAIERLDGRICVSEACIGSLTPYYPYAYDVIPNGIDSDHFSPDAEPVAELLGDHQNIVFVRPLRPPKRPRHDDRGPSAAASPSAAPRCGWSSSVTARCAALPTAGRRRARALRALRRPPQSQPAQLPGHRRRVLHAVQPGLVRDGAARGDELWSCRRRQPHQRLPAADGGRPPGVPRCTPAKSPELHAEALSPAARQPRAARADGRRGSPHGTRALRVAAGRREARGVLLRPDRRRATGMGKRQVISSLRSLGAAWMAAAAMLAVTIEGILGDLVFTAAVVIAIRSRGGASRPTRGCSAA